MAINSIVSEISVSCLSSVSPWFLWRPGRPNSPPAYSSSSTVVLEELYGSTLERSPASSQPLPAWLRWEVWLLQRVASSKHSLGHDTQTMRRLLIWHPTQLVTGCRNSLRRARNESSATLWAGFVFWVGKWAIQQSDTSQEPSSKDSSLSTTRITCRNHGKVYFSFGQC